MKYHWNIYEYWIGRVVTNSALSRRAWVHLMRDIYLICLKNFFFSQTSASLFWKYGNFKKTMLRKMTDPKNEKKRRIRHERKIFMCVVVLECKNAMVAGMKRNKPSATLADVASWLIQKLTHESITMSIQGKYVWKTKYPTLRFSWNTNERRWYAPEKY